MKLAVLKENMQELFNAVVVQAAVDYRRASIRLMKKPDDKAALAMLEDCRSFFLSDDICFYTSVPGAVILHRLEMEQEENRKKVEAFRELKAKLARARQAFVDSNYCDESILEKAAIIAAGLKEMSLHTKGTWKKLYTLERKDKKIMQEFENWRKELKWQKKAS